VGFEFDERKSRANLAKHGIDFVQAQSLWDDDNLVGFEVNTASELRHILIGRLGGKYYTAVITYRGENVRIISVRRSRKKEEDFYENNS
jgi:uncharacterized DUF497 family protein